MTSQASVLCIYGNVPQSYVSTGAVLTEQQLCNPAEPDLQGTKVELDEPEHLVIKEEWEEPEPLQLEEESGELGVHQDKAQPIPVIEEMGHSESELNGERLLFQNSGEGGMLVKTKIENEQNCVKIEQPSLDEFLNPASQDKSLSDCFYGSSSSSHFILGASFPLSPVHGPFTGSAPELFHHHANDAVILEVGSSGPRSPLCKRQKVKWMDQTAKQLVESALTKEPAGGQILQEYMQTKSLTDCSRRKLVNIIAADMSDIYGTAPPRRVRERYARGIIETFPNLRDPYSKNGYEHFYNGESGTGFLAWRLKTLQRKNPSSERRRSSCRLTGGGPTARREASFTPLVTQSQEQTSQDRSLSDRINGSSSSSRCILGASFPPSPVHGPFTGSAPELSHHRSDDTHILGVGSSGPYTPPSKRQKVKWMNQTAKQLVESALTKEPAGGQILQEYMQTNSLTDCSRRKLVNIIAADMSDIYGTAPPRRVRERYARGIIETFPNLRDPCSKNGYEHFYNGESGTGYLAWRLKTLQRKNTSSERRRSSCRLTGGGPTARREALFTPLVTQNEEQHKEAISFMKNSSDEAAIKNKMKTTFDFRRKMVLDKKRSSDILMEFPRFRDVKGLIDQDFILEFGEDVSSMFLDRWPIFKQKVIQQSKTLPISSDLEKLIQCAERASSEEEPEENLSSGWDSDLSSIILLLHLIPPSCQGRKRPGKVSASQAEKHLVVFLKSGRSIQEHVEAFSSTTQPYLLAVGTKRSSIHEFFIVLNTQVIPCKSASSLEAFDELFKAHFVFGSVYHHTLHSMYTFIQTTIYNIDVGKVQETPRVAEIRARLLK
ncbi:uncharacterized protein LOC119791231 [Cyprinodon tularosa]|uniref:uncharacterized protein LOC119791231 n=1 Tax=Cyprinodon tularosa TaxID=77115 RepID=UPI0018E22E32|nr:uncharacterized protein LOC119791231 [Cyprinodon tularosa]